MGGGGQTEQIQISLPSSKDEFVELIHSDEVSDPFGLTPLSILRLLNSPKTTDCAFKRYMLPAATNGRVYLPNSDTFSNSCLNLRKYSFILYAIYLFTFTYSNKIIKIS